jgi:hypothetical protein
VAGNVGSKDPLQLDMTGVKATKVFDELLNDPGLDVIDICAPTAAHRDLSLAAPAGGQACPVRKAARTDRRNRAGDRGRSARREGIFHAGHVPPFLAGMGVAQGGHRAGPLWKSAGRAFPARRRTAGWGQKGFFNGAESGGALFDLHIHDTDFVQYCFGLPRAVFSTGYVRFSGAVDHVVTQYEVASGAAVHAEGGWAMTAGFGFNMSYT